VNSILNAMFRALELLGSSRFVQRAV
jgi:hypothetical protein